MARCCFFLCDQSKTYFLKSNDFSPEKQHQIHKSSLILYFHQTAKGILVTTSTYGPDARSFAKDKPIELIDGRVLLHMLEEQGVQAKIIFNK
ncbi:restriction endonuclease [Paenibacillus glycanilyticus]|uniref:restriction endonuclease n=1 Tax=Paenibacillus glycanilyticus TaxID=126569 RepID=UPI000FDB9C77|nr:restriction endonuclease [Paenibacillus glycanilyticus]